MFTAILFQVVTSSGDKGHNVEYVLKLAEWFRSTLPEESDDHLFTLESHVRREIAERSMCLGALMAQGCSGYCDGHEKAREEEAVMSESEDESASSEGEDSAGASGSGAFAERVGRKALRCVKV